MLSTFTPLDGSSFLTASAPGVPFALADGPGVPLPVGTTPLIGVALACLIGTTGVEGVTLAAAGFGAGIGVAPGPALCLKALLSPSIFP